MQKEQYKACKANNNGNKILYMKANLADIGSSDRCTKSPC